MLEYFTEENSEVVHSTTNMEEKWKKKKKKHWHYNIHYLPWSKTITNSF